MFGRPYVIQQSAGSGVASAGKLLVKPAATSTTSPINLTIKRARAVLGKKPSAGDRLTSQRLYEAVYNYATENAGITDKDPALQQAGLEAILDEKP